MTSKQRLLNQIKKLGNKIDLTLGEFNNLKQIGQGGNSVVYAATLIDKQIAIKFLLTEETGNLNSPMYLTRLNNPKMLFFPFQSRCKLISDAYRQIAG